MPPAAVQPGCEPWSHAAASGIGVLVVHGFTGAPASVRELAEAFAAAGFDVELPRLPGHGTSIDDMLTTAWGDWKGEVGRAAADLAARVDRVVLAGQSMGATLILSLALDGFDTTGLVCINPPTQLRDDDTMGMIDELIDDGMRVVPGGPSDIADPDSSDFAYTETPLAPLRSLLRDGIEPITSRFGELTMPLRLFTSRQDHVVPPTDSTHLADTYGGPVEHTWLEHSFHVVTRDFDRGAVLDAAVRFVADLAVTR